MSENDNNEVKPEVSRVLTVDPSAAHLSESAVMDSVEVVDGNAVDGNAVDGNVVADPKPDDPKPDDRVVKFEAVDTKSEHKPDEAKKPEPSVVKKNHPTDLRISRDQLDQMTACIKDVLDGRKITASMLIRITANCMMLTKKMKTNSLVSKKLVIKGIEEYIKSSDAGLNEEETDALMTLVDITVDDAFDTLRDVDKGTVQPGRCCIIV